MCIFSQTVRHVGRTRIFARKVGVGSQILVYSMTVQAQSDTAMVLPLPMPFGASEQAVEFINLQCYPEFFDEMERGFPLPIVATAGPRLQLDPVPLKVHAVGDFEASFVPTRDDWGRLDPRFRIPPIIWDAVPAYNDYGFAVFKLRSEKRRTWFRRVRPLKKQIHPMAFRFPVRENLGVYYPTIHIHDGRFHAQEKFDHVLYGQFPGGMRGQLAEDGWRQADKPVGAFVDLEKAGQVLDPDMACFRRGIYGLQDNRDVIVKAS